MFETADEILRRRGLMPYDCHAISWGWDGFQPGLEVYDLQAKELADLTSQFVPGAALDLTISEARRCVGSFVDGRYEPCMLRQVVSGQHDQCPRCASTWIPVQNCVFEPECDGVHRTNPKCQEGGGTICAKEHHVYAAFYGELVKVGMTLSSRLMERGVEQGADAMARLGSYPNRLEARRAENVISKAMHATQWVRKNTFLKVQGRRLDREAYQQMLERLLSPLGGELVRPDPVQMLDRYPLLPLDLGRITFAEVPGRHRGEVLGCKGKWLFYRLRDGSVRMLDMSSVPSRYVSSGQGNHNKA